MQTTSDTNMQYRMGGEIRIKGGQSDGDWTLEVLGVPYGGHNKGLDDDGESFADDSDLWLKLGDQRPVAYYHGLQPDGTPQQRPQVIGVATFTRRDERGGWFKVRLDGANALARRVWQAALSGTARASTGALGHLVRVAKGGLIQVWPVGELSLFDTGNGRQPSNQLATAVPLKALFEAAGLAMPPAFVQAQSSMGDLAQAKGAKRPMF